MKVIIKKELLEHFQTVQFIVLVVLSIILFSINGIIFVKKYKEQISIYNEKVSEIYNNPSTVRTTLYKKPSQLIFLSEGGEKYQPKSYNLEPKGRLRPHDSGPRNYKLPDVPELDWAFIIKVIFSLYAILLGYNAVSGEKEQGTLRQILSNSISRIEFLSAKYISIVLILLIPLVIGCIFSSLIIGISIPSLFTLNNLIKISLMFFLSLIYLSLFAFLSLLFSSIIHRSSIVLLVLLAIWIIFAIIIPNTAGILAQRFSDIPSELQIAKRLKPTIEKEIWARIDEIREKIKRGEIKTEEEVKKEADRAFDEGQEKLMKYYQNYYESMKQRTIKARNLACLSPTALFQYASENIAQTGIVREKQFLKDALQYSKVYDNYILKKVGKLIGSSAWRFGTYITINGKTISISSPYPIEYQGDKSDFPKFVENNPSILANLKNALINFIGLILWNLILAVFAFVSFLNSDVR